MYGACDALRRLALPRQALLGAANQTKGSLSCSCYKEQAEFIIAMQRITWLSSAVRS